MVKAPSFSSRAGGSSYGDKFKSWRKGKGAKSKKGGSLKHQLRGLERLLAKTQDDAERQKQLTKSIQDLKQQIADKEMVEKERQNAKKSHGARFLDRQRLTRQWQLFEKQEHSTKSKDELFRLGWDMLYVAHFPHAKMSYQSLFTTNKVRAQPRGRALAKLVSARQAICKILNDEETLKKVAWVPETVYSDMEIPKDWTTKLEKTTYNYDEKDSKKGKGMVSDDRFPTSEDGQSKVLEAAQAIEAELDRLEQEEEDEESEGTSSKSSSHQKSQRASNMAQSANDSSSTGSSEYGIDDSDDDSNIEADPLEKPKANKKAPSTSVAKVPKDDDGESSWSSSSSSSDDDDDSSSDEEDATPKLKTQSQKDESSSDDSSTSSSSSSSDSEDDTGEPSTKKQKTNNNVEKKAAKEEESEEDEPMVQDDGFLIPADDSANHKKAFANAKQHIPERLAGDKSQGWATQRQRPGQFNRRQQSGRRGF